MQNIIKVDTYCSWRDWCSLVIRCLLSINPDFPTCLLLVQTRGKFNQDFLIMLNYFPKLKYFTKYIIDAIHVIFWILLITLRAMSFYRPHCIGYLDEDNWAQIGGTKHSII